MRASVMIGETDIKGSYFSGRLGDILRNPNEKTIVHLMFETAKQHTQKQGFFKRIYSLTL